VRELNAQLTLKSSSDLSSSKKYLMNKVVDQRRGDIFEDNMSVSSMTVGLSGRGNALEEKSFVRNDTNTLTNMSS
jgi:hypothetical protein